MNLNQTLQTKFPHLEVSCLKLSEVQKDNETKRIDSEYFKKEYLQNEEIIGVNYQILADISKKICNGSTPTNGIFETDGIPFFRSQDFNLLDTEPKQYITKDFHNFLKRSTIRHKDILVAIIGATLGKIGFVAKNIAEANINQNVAKIRICDKNFNSYFVATFLDTYYGQYQIFRLATQTAQEYLNNIQVGKIKIPLLPMDFQLEIQKLVKDSHFALEQSKELYKEAQNMLYIELGLNPDNPLQSILDFHPTPKGQDSKLTQKSLKQNLNISIRTLKESLGTSGRLDSEYYQNKYDKIESYIKDYKEGFNKLEFIEIKDSNFTPKAKEKYRYIELANIGANGSISAPLEEFGKDLPTRARRIVKEGDLIVSSIEGSLSSCALITQEFDNCIVSTGFYILKSLHINSETLLVLFKSQVFQEYLKKFPSGTILTAISKDELQNILIPKIDFKTQEKIASCVQKSFELRAKAKALLDEAKARVENAINDRKFNGQNQKKGKQCIKNFKSLI